MARQMIECLKMRQSFKGMTANVGECLTYSSEIVAYISDDEQSGKSHFVDNSGEHDKCLKVVNLQKREYSLLSIDHCLVNDREGGIADCGVFDDRTFWMVEFKSNALGKTDMAVSETYRKAISQIKETIKLFTDKMKEADVDFVEASDLHCDIVTAQSFPKLTALEQNLSIEFAMDNNGIHLIFSRTIDF